jgi:serine/threonine-protein kinase
MATIIQHAREEPIPPSARAEEEIDAELERIILECLAKEPDDRPQSAQELSARLAEVDANLGAWSQARAERWWRAHQPQHVAAPTYPPIAAASPVETS